MNLLVHFQPKRGPVHCNVYCSPPFIRGVTAVANLAQALLSINSVHTILWGGGHEYMSLPGKEGNGNSLEVIMKDKNGWR